MIPHSGQFITESLIFKCFNLLQVYSLAAMRKDSLCSLQSTHPSHGKHTALAFAKTSDEGLIYHYLNTASLTSFFSFRTSASV